MVSFGKQSNFVNFTKKIVYKLYLWKLKDKANYNRRNSPLLSVCQTFKKIIMYLKNYLRHSCNRRPFTFNIRFLVQSYVQTPIFFLLYCLFSFVKHLLLFYSNEFNKPTAILKLKYNYITFEFEMKYKKLWKFSVLYKIWRSNWNEILCKIINNICRELNK